MSKLTKVMLVLAGIFILVGGMLMCISIFIGIDGKVYWDSDENKVVVLDKDDFAKQEKIKVDSFKNINIDVSVVNIELIPSDDYYIEYKLYSKDEKDIYKIENGTLTFKAKDNYAFQFNIGDFLSDDECYIKVYYPEGAELDTVYLGTSVGDIHTDGLYAVSLSCDTSTGEVKVNNSKITTLDCDTSVGDIRINNSEAGELNASTSTGDIVLDRTDIFKNSRLDTSVGDIEVSFGGKTKLEDYSISADTSVGEVEVDGIEEGEEFSTVNGGGVAIVCSTSTGDIEFTTR